jgi:hypothetical protein
VPASGSMGRKLADGHLRSLGTACRTHLRMSPSEGRGSVVIVPVNGAQSVVISNRRRGRHRNDTIPLVR